MSRPFFTIGHSTRSLEEFVGLIAEADIRLVVDVRTVPRSRTNPQFNPDVFAAALAESRIGYQHIAALGGLRGRTSNIAAEVNSFWKNRSFHNYADYAMSAAFRSGLAELRRLGHASPCAIMCAEAVWWRCHRRIIADYLLASGETVFHILGNRRIETARLTAAAKLQPEGTLSYPSA